MASGLSLAVEVSLDDKAVRALLGRALRRAINLRPALAEIGERMGASVHHHFATQTGPDGPWAPLKDSTIKAKERLGYSDKILQAKGRMLRTMHPTIEEHSVSYGTNIRSKDGFPYPAVPHKGTRRAGRGHNITIPARPWAYVTKSDVDAFNEILRRHVLS